MKREKYNTVTKKIILSKIRSINASFSAKDIKNSLNEVGLTTIYRYLDELEKDGYLKKYYGDSNTAKYEYLDRCEEENHFYLKCINCGETIHVDCNCIEEFKEHILEEHLFNMADNNLFITGICDKCKGENL